MTTCQYVAEERVEPYEVRTCRYVPEERVEIDPGDHLLSTSPKSVSSPTRSASARWSPRSASRRSP